MVIMVNFIWLISEKIFTYSHVVMSSNTQNDCLYVSVGINKNVTAGRLLCTRLMFPVCHGVCWSVAVRKNQSASSI